MYDSRNQIPQKYKWNLSEIYSSRDAFESDFADVDKEIRSFALSGERISKSADGLLNVLSEYNRIYQKLRKLSEYAERNSDVDLSDNGFQSLAAKVRMLYNDLGSASFFVVPAVCRIPEKKLVSWYKEQPGLLSFKRVIDRYRRYRKHLLSDSEEKLFADLSNALQSHETIRSIFANADLQFGFVKDDNGKRVPLNDSTYVPLVMSQNRNVRRNAFRSLYKTYDQYGNTFANLLNGFVREMTTIAEVRHFENSLEASVFEDEVPSSIYHNLVQTVRDHMSPLFEYYELKRKLLNVEKLHLYDVYTPLIASQSRQYEYDEAVDIVLDALKIYGPDYISVLEKGLRKDGWVDVYPTKGKRGGVYSAGCYETKPYILLNFSGTFDNISTLAHEAGHSMHSYFSRKNNDSQNSEYTIFVAEVASTVNELLLSHHLLKTSKDKSIKMNILDELMSTYKSTLYRQTMFAEFEEFIHHTVETGEPLTKEILSDEYYQLNLRYFGKDVVCDRQIQYEWMRVPHFYYNFYVYKYATCICAASAIVKKIESEGQPYIKKYLDFLSCGNSKSPLDSLLVAEIDMRKPDVILAGIDDFRNAVSQFKDLLEES